METAPFSGCTLPLLFLPPASGSLPRIATHSFQLFIGTFLDRLPGSSAGVLFCYSPASLSRRYLGDFSETPSLFYFPLISPHEETRPPDDFRRVAGRHPRDQDLFSITKTAGDQLVLLMMTSFSRLRGAPPTPRISNFHRSHCGEILHDIPIGHLRYVRPFFGSRRALDLRKQSSIGPARLSRFFHTTWRADFRLFLRGAPKERPPSPYIIYALGEVPVLRTNKCY